MNTKKVNGIFVLSVLFVVLGGLHYETNSPTSSMTFDGAKMGIGLLVIIGVVLLFKLTSLWADILASSGKIANRPKFPYDWLILAAMLTNSFGYRASGKWITGIGEKSVPSWLFDWGNGEWKGHFIVAVIAIALLLRVYAIAGALLATTKRT